MPASLSSCSKPPNKRAKLMRVVAPLGCFALGEGLKLALSMSPRRFCQMPANGLRAGGGDGRQELGQLRTAKTATFIIFEDPEEGIGLPDSVERARRRV